MSTPNDYPQPPVNPPDYLKFLLGLPSDCSREEFANEWQQQVVPLLANGPAHLLDRESKQLMGAGLTYERAYRALKQTKRGEMLSNSAERERNARLRKRAATPAFLKPKK